MSTDATPGVPMAEVQWVTKTNVTDYHRCPRAYWPIAHGEITHEESIAPHDLPQVVAGVEFERDLVAGASPVEYRRRLSGGGASGGRTADAHASDGPLGQPRPQPPR
jgi:hypothetical protein